MELVFDYSKCIHCGNCLSNCKEKAIKSINILDLKKIHHPVSVLKKVRFAICKKCDNPIMSENLVPNIERHLSSKKYGFLLSNYCPECRLEAELSAEV